MTRRNNMIISKRNDGIDMLIADARCFVEQRRFGHNALDKDTCTLIENLTEELERMIFLWEQWK